MSYSEYGKRWRYCRDCCVRYCATTEREHNRTHVERPREDLLTATEAAVVLGISREACGLLIRRGKLASERHDGYGMKRNRWVSRKALKAYIGKMLEKDPLAAERITSSWQ